MPRIVVLLIGPQDPIEDVARLRDGRCMMDGDHFDQFTRRLTKHTTRRRGLAAAVAAVAGLAPFVTEARRRRGATCPEARKCGGSCCKGGHVCLLGRCQRQQHYEDRLKENGEECKGASCGPRVCVDAPHHRICVSGYCNQHGIVPFEEYHCAQPEDCTALLDPCSSNDQCCSGVCSPGGQCASTWCKGQGHDCETDRDCCTLNCPPNPDGTQRKCAAFG